MKRKLFQVVFILTLCLASLSACGKKSEEPAKSEEPSSAVAAEEKKEEQKAPVQEPEAAQEPAAKEPETENSSEGFENSGESVRFNYVSYHDAMTADDGFEALGYFENMPEFDIAGNPEATKTINDFFALMTKGQHEDFESLAAEALADYNDFGNEIEDYPEGYMENSCEIVRSDDNVISVIQTYTVFYPGSDHPSYDSTCYSFRTKTGEVLVNDEIFNDPQAVNEMLKARIEYEASEGEYKDVLYPEYRELIENIFSDNNWFFDAEGITLIVNPSEFAPYEAGRLSFAVSYDDLAGNLKDDYILPGSTK